MKLCEFCQQRPATTTVDVGVEQITTKNVCNSCRDSYLNNLPINGQHMIKHVRPESERDAGIRRIREDGYKQELSKEQSDSFVVMWLTGELEYVEREDGLLGWYRPEEN